MILIIIILLILLAGAAYGLLRKPKNKFGNVKEISSPANVDTEAEIRKRIDLHYGKKDFSTNRNYVEFSFHAPFGEVFNIEEYEPNPNLTGNELFEILNVLTIPHDKNLILKKSIDDSNDSVEIFHSTDDEQVFAYFDLIRNSTDQIGMFFLGIRCHKKDEKKIHETLLDIFRKLKTSSAFVFDILNNQLYPKAFHSYFYFYSGNYNSSKPSINHHNLIK
jgi:hypothetical protein